MLFHAHAAFEFPFLYLFELSQTLCIAYGFAGILHLQQERFVCAVGATAPAARHGQVVDGTETAKAGIAANLVHGATQDHLMFGLWEHYVLYFRGKRVWEEAVISRSLWHTISFIIRATNKVNDSRLLMRNKEKGYILKIDRFCFAYNAVFAAHVAG